MRQSRSLPGQRTRSLTWPRRETRTRRGRTRTRGAVASLGARPGRGRRRPARRRRCPAYGRRRPPAGPRTATRSPPLQVAAVVYGAAADGDLAADGRRPCVAPALPSGCRMPGRSAVDGDLDAADPSAAAVDGGAADGDRVSGRDGSGGVAGRRARRGRIVRGDRRGQAGLARRRLDAHVGEQVDRGLLHRDARRRAAAVMLVVEPPGPLHRAGSEHQRPTRVPIERQVMGRRVRAVV